MNIPSFKAIFMAPAAKRISSVYGWRVHPVRKERLFHNGVDIPLPIGSPLYAPYDYEVIMANEHSAGGKQIRLKHPNNVTTGYAHLDQILVKPGQRGKAGDLIARSGNTGAGTGPHLHFTMRETSMNETFDPAPYLIW